MNLLINSIAKIAFLLMCFGYIGMMVSMYFAPDNEKLRQAFFNVAVIGSIVIVVIGIIFIGGTF